MDQDLDRSGELLWRAANAWQRRAAGALRPIGLGYVQYVLLEGLATLAVAGDRPSQAALARHVGCDPMTASQALRTLERRRLVARRRDAGDPRAMALTVTSLGEAALARARPALGAGASGFFASLGPEAPAFAEIGRAHV